MRPIILTTPSIIDDEKFLRSSRAYSRAIEKAGGITLIPDCAGIENIPRLLEISDGILLTGGCDIDPFFFGEEPIREIDEISPMRDIFEIELLKLAAERGMPILAICRGAQVLNVAFGGKVYQDIYSQFKTSAIKHSQVMPGQYASHSIKMDKASILNRILGTESARVNSFHHQAVSVLGDGMKVSAFSGDGVIEAIEHSEMAFCVGVQWHPERMFENNPGQFKIFTEFIRAAKNNIKRMV